MNINLFVNNKLKLYDNMNLNKAKNKYMYICAYTLLLLFIFMHRTHLGIYDNNNKIYIQFSLVARTLVMDIGITSTYIR